MGYDVFRIVAAEDSTIVNISCTLNNSAQGYIDTISFNESSFTDVRVNSTDFCWMEADESILLLQFAVGTSADNVPSDPFMALVPAVSHYTNSFTLPVVNSSLNDFTHYLNIIIPAEHYQPDQIYLDGHSLQSLALAEEFVAVIRNKELETMAYAGQIEVNATTHTLIHGNSTGVFGVISYGLAFGASYGHIGGMQLPQYSAATDSTVTVTESNSIDMITILVATLQSLLGFLLLFGGIVLGTYTPVYDTVKGACDHDSIQLHENPAYDSVYWKPKTRAYQE